MKPVRIYRHRRVALAIHLLLLVSFILLLLVAISMSILKPVYLMSVHATPQKGQPATSIATELRFGVWGFCATSVLNQPGLLSNDGECTHPRLGYKLDATASAAILELTGQPQLINAVLKSLTVILILHPISAGLCLLTLLLSFWFFMSENHCASILALIFALVNALLTTISCAVDIAIVAVARSRVPGLTGGLFGVGFGNAPWMTLVAVVFVWIAVVLLSGVSCDCLGIGHYRGDSYVDDTRDGTTIMAERRK
ncbi:hypothetical protein BD410DRAFT_901114 [Rickenella mellea]|uniref:Pali-domain-containing protein n=1 Tax=Rickenella mellea TaxID=50990 RepID=A0A4Y7PSL3_9AGAM|nr:hypothetical protein BD410DRAFT_901114 [Rickenella mellea]